MANISNRKITSWDNPGFDRCEEYGPYDRNARGKRLSIVKSLRKVLNRKFRKGNKVDINKINED